jgi:Fe-S cluster assembly protein SufD
MAAVAAEETAGSALERSFAESFRESRSRRDPQWLIDLRRGAMERFRETGFPTPRDEDWKHTNVAPIVKVPFAPAPEEGPRAVRRAQPAVPVPLPGGDGGIQLVFVNGRYASELSSGAAEGIRTGSLREVLAREPEFVEPHLGRIARNGNAFASANAAFVDDGAFVRISRGVAARAPIHLVFLSEPVFDPTLSHPRNLVIAEAGSQAAILETYIGTAGETYFTNAVTEVSVGEGANLELYKLERESTAAYHIATTEVRLERDSRFVSHSLAFGGAIARNDLNVRLEAEGAECTLNGLFVGSGTQHLDNHTLIDHAKPHGTSRELYKGIMDGKSRGIFHGKIIVRPDAQKTDAMQTNKNLLLSRDALVNSIPALEIFADDVKCRHGSTIGQLDPGAMFYLQSRGIGALEARELLVYAFASDVTSRIRISSLRALVDEHLGLQLPGGHE